MQHDRHFAQAASFRNIGFSEKVQKCLDRALRLDVQFLPASWADAVPLLNRARRDMALAPETLIRDLHRHNPEILRIAEVGQGDARRTGLFCYLPLNELGASALADGSFDGKAPKVEWICGAGVAPAAIYLWLVYMPGTLGQMMGVIANAFDALTPEGCPVFSKAVTPHAERLNRSMGFLAARDFYPACSPELLVIFPQKKPEKAKPKQHLQVAIARDLADLMKAFTVRSATYIAEQYCHYEEEFDGNDLCATHMLGTVDGDAAGCIRMRFFAGFAKIERLAVRREYRNSKLAFELARAAVRHCRMKGYTLIYGHSRLDLVRFWKMFGFAERPDGRDFAFANVRYVEIVCQQSSLPEALTLDAEPLVLIRPEGAWDVPGPLDRSPSEQNPVQRAMLAQSTRTVGNRAITRQAG